jgi:hypothetical protein
MTTTVGAMIDRILDRMEARTEVSVDLLTGTINSSVTSLALDLDHTKAQAHGSILEIGTEQLFVMSYSAPNYTVIRGWNGTSAASHTAGDMVVVNPRFPRSRVLQLIEEEIRSWPDTVGQITSTEVSFGATATVADTGLSAGTDLRMMLKVQTEPFNAYDQWRRLEAELIPDVDASDFASGYGLQPGGPLGVATTVHCTWLTGFTLTNIATEATNLNTAVGVSATLEEALLYGVMSRAMAGKEIPRTDEKHAQQQERDGRVPPTHMIQTMAVYQGIRDKAIHDESRRIRAEFPYRKSSV